MYVVLRTTLCDRVGKTCMIHLGQISLSEMDSLSEREREREREREEREREREREGGGIKCHNTNNSITLGLIEK